MSAQATVGLAALAASTTQDDIGPAIRALYPRVVARLDAAGVLPSGPSVAYYVPAPEESEDALWIRATFPVATPEVDGLDTVEIPAAEVASSIHHGAMDGIDGAYQRLHTWAREQGLVPTGAAREIYLETADDPADWVTEVQLDVTR